MPFGEASLSLVIAEMPLVEVLRLLSETTGLSFVAEADLDEKVVTVEAKDVSIERLMHMISRRIGVDVHRVGDVWYVGSFKEEDRAILVRRVKRLSPPEVQEAVTVLLSSEGRVAVYDDGLVVIGDRLQLVSRIASLLDEIEKNEGAVWAVQLWLVSISSGDVLDIGVDVAPSLDVAVAFAEGSASGMASTALSGGLSAILEAAEEQTGAEMVMEHMALMRDGVEHAFFEGQQFPVRLNRVSDEGTSTVANIEFVEVGVQLDGSLRDFSSNSALISFEVDLSELAGVIDGVAPSKTTTRFDVQAEVRSGGIYLLRSHKTRVANQSISALLRPGQRQESTERVLQLWCRANRIDGGPVTAERSDVRSGAQAAPAHVAMVQSNQHEAYVQLRGGAFLSHLPD